MSTTAVGPGWRSGASRLGFVAAASLLLVACLSVLEHPAYWARPETIAPAVLVDLALGLPLLGYLLLVRTGQAKPRVVAPLFALGLGLGAWWIPASHLRAETLLVAAPIVVEGALLVIVLVRLRRVVERYRKERRRGQGVSDALRAGLVRGLGRAAGEAVAGELIMLRYAFGGWGRPAPAPPGASAFTLHRRNAYPALVGAISMAVFAETAAAHLLLSLWSPLAAWIATGLSAYSLAWIVGDLHAARHEPHLVTDEGLRLRVGLRWRVDVPWSQVVALHDTPPDGPVLQLGLTKGADLWLETRRPVTVRGPFGLRRRVELIGLKPDRPGAFATAVRERMGPGGAPPARQKGRARGEPRG